MQKYSIHISEVIQYFIISRNPLGNVNIDEKMPISLSVGENIRVFILSERHKKKVPRRLVKKALLWESGDVKLCSREWKVSRIMAERRVIRLPIGFNNRRDQKTARPCKHIDIRPPGNTQGKFYDCASTWIVDIATFSQGEKQVKLKSTEE